MPYILHFWTHMYALPKNPRNSCVRNKININGRYRNINSNDLKWLVKLELIHFVIDITCVGLRECDSCIYAVGAKYIQILPNRRRNKKSITLELTPVTMWHRIGFNWFKTKRCSFESDKSDDYYYWMIDWLIDMVIGYVIIFEKI